MSESGTTSPKPSWGMMPASDAPPSPPQRWGPLSRIQERVARLPSPAEKWTHFTRKYRWFILPFFVCTWGLVPFFGVLLNETSNEIQLVSGSPSLKAKKATEQAFPGVVRVGTLIVLFKSPHGLAAVQEAWCGWEDALNDAVFREHPCADYSTGDCFLKSNVTSWCALTAQDLTYLAADLVDDATADGGVGSSKAAQVLVQYDADAATDKVQGFVSFLSKKARDLRPQGLGVSVGTTGWDAFTVASVEGAFCRAGFRARRVAAAPRR